MTGDHKNNTETYEGLSKFYRDTTKILRPPAPRPPPPAPRPSTKNDSPFYLCVQAAHFMELRTKKITHLFTSVYKLLTSWNSEQAFL